MSIRKKCLLIVAGVFVFFIVVGAIGSMMDSSPAGPAPTPTARPTSTPVPPIPTATPPPGPTSTPIPPTPTPEPLTTSGSGSSVLAATLGKGKYIVGINVTGNTDCSFGSCRATNFVVKFGDELLANEIVEDWSGQKIIDVGGFWIQPGRIAVEIDAAPQSQWALTIQPF